jgi:hypothetical protein
MKIINILVIVIAITLCAGISAAQMERHDFERSPNFDKLDLRAKEAWRTAVSSGKKDAEFSCMLKVEDRLTPDQKNKLGLAGFKPGTIIQTIVTGRVTVEDLPKVAALNFVKVVELAVPLNLKADPGYKRYSKPKKEKRAPTTKPAGKTPSVAKTEAPSPKAETPVKELESPPKDLPSDGSEVPIYESTPPSATPDPDRPMTSDDVQPEEPAIAPVDQAPPVVQPERTITQPAVEPVKEE